VLDGILVTDAANIKKIIAQPLHAFSDVALLVYSTRKPQAYKSPVSAILGNLWRPSLWTSKYWLVKRQLRVVVVLYTIYVKKPSQFTLSLQNSVRVTEWLKI